MADDALVSQVVSEVLGSGTSNARASQVVSEVLAIGTLATDHERISQVTTDVLAIGTISHIRVSQIYVEVLVKLGGRRRIPYGWVM